MCHTGLHYIMTSNCILNFKCILFAMSELQSALHYQLLYNATQLIWYAILFSLLQFPFIYGLSLQWRHNDHDGISNHWHLNCLLNCMFWHRSKKTSKLHVTGPLCGESTGNFPIQRASNTENVSIWWHHHDTSQWVTKCILTSFRDCVTLIINRFPSI